MPEPYTRCANCGATLAAHDDPEVRTCPQFMEDTTVVPLLPAPAVEQLDPHVHLLATLERLEAQFNQLGADLALTSAGLGEAEAVNVLWGAFDYELDMLAERFGIDLEPDRSPLDAVRALMAMARNAPEIPIYEVTP
ncbi:MAG TPA: hypothetical protein VJ140_14020 [Actinomycetota bacterium]|nr:hypothetical protein [Actinomycetota bacterium]